MAKTSRIGVGEAHAYWERSETPQRRFPLRIPFDEGGRALPLTRSPFYELYGKRALDIVGSLALLIFFGPVILVLIAITAVSGGRPIFGHTRIGRHGRPFRCLKIRTMVVDADVVLQTLLRTDPHARAEWQRAFKLDRDPRITPLGRFLRKTSLDELPQLVNVLRGEMSLVGPRPVPGVELERYAAGRRSYLAVRPGITGLWQVVGRNGVSYERRVAMDVMYVRRLSLWGDLRILLATIGAVLNTTGK